MICYRKPEHGCCRCGEEECQCNAGGCAEKHDTIP
jgi:hypothetical protein